MSLLRQLAKAYAEQRIDRRTYIHERRRLIDEAVAGIESARPQVLEPVPANLTETDVTVKLTRDDLETTVKLPSDDSE